MGSAGAEGGSYDFGWLDRDGTELGAAGLDELAEEILEGVPPTVAGLPAGVEAVRRIGERASYLFVVNHTRETVIVPVRGTDLLSDTIGAPQVVRAGGVAVIREG